MIGLICLKKFILTKRKNHVNVLFVITITFLKINFRFQSKVYDTCHDLIQKALNFNDVGIFLSKEIIIEFIFWYVFGIKFIRQCCFIRYTFSL